MSNLFESLLSAPVKFDRPQIMAENHDTQAARQSCANLAARNGQVSIVVAGKAAWHGLGVQVADALTSRDALHLASLDNWQLTKLPLMVELPDGRQISAGGFGVTRQDTGHVLGTVGSRYEIVTNEECFDFVDDVFAEHGARYETAGALGNGEKVWMLAKLPATSRIAGCDQLDSYALLVSSHDGSSSVQFFGTSVRVVCQNTYNAALSAGRKSGIRMRHTKNVKRNVEAARESIGLVAKQTADFVELANNLADTRLADPRPYFQRVVDETSAPYRLAGMDLSAATTEPIRRAIIELPRAEARELETVKLERALKARRSYFDELIGRYDEPTNNGMREISGSAWAAVNTVTEHAQHSSQVHYRGDRQAESRFLSIVDGRANETARAAIAIAQDMAS